MLDIFPHVSYGVSMTSTRTERRVLGGAVKRIREAQGHKLDPIARKAGISVSYLCNIEAGRKMPAPSVMVALANALGVDFDDITYTTNVIVLDAEDVA